METTQNNRSDRGGSNKLSGRYRSIIIFITVFVLLIVGLLSLNFYISVQFEEDSYQINMAGRQRMLSQRTAKTLKDVILTQQKGGDVSLPYNELQTTFDLFDTTLNGFDVGGPVTDTQLQANTMNPVSIAPAREAVNNAKALWQEYRTSVVQVLQSDVASLQILSDSIKQLNEVNEPLLNTMNDLTQALERNAQDATLVNIAGRQRMLSQKMTKHLQEIVAAQSGLSSLETPFNNLVSTITVFNDTLNAFDQGGTVLNTDGTTIQVDALQDPELRLIIEEANDLWSGTYTNLQMFVDGGDTPSQKLKQANALAETNNLQLLKLMNDLTLALEQDSSSRSDLLRMIQLIGIIFALVMFGVIVFYFIRQLSTAESQLITAKGETDRILETVRDGLFLMNPDHTIGNQYSDSLTDIINVKQPAGKNFLSILRKIVPEKTLKTAEDYLGLLLGDRVNEELVKDLNPLDQVEVYFGGEGIDKSVGHLGFSFNRVVANEKISHLLVQVNDITEKVILERELQESQEKAQAQFDLMLQVLHVEPDQLTQYLAGTEKSLREINDILQERSPGEAGNREKLDNIFRLMHRIKGDAAALSLEAFEQKAHDFETIMDTMREKNQLSGKDFLPLAISLDDFLSQIESLRTLILKLGELQHSVKYSDIQAPEKLESTLEDPPTSMLYSKLNDLSQKVAQDENKEVQLIIQGEENIPEGYQQEVSDILTQLIRNSIVHGIESENERQIRKKPEEGLIRINITKNVGNEIVIQFQDDGRGLSKEKIVHAAVNKGLINTEQAAKLTNKHIIGLIFKSGFSTSSEVDKNSGRGVGMDVVASQIRELHGNLNVKTSDGEFCQFIITLPEIKAYEHV
ncbi:type IV pili methyl-accepting chemotaxis transducer N-terminal domain-containing protein [Marinicella sp. W31]|uniref:type IV pili methyl-accepting chemotaxis transducer N-terminal domain-containing protein n=1 Tax=Marinicella sp. W31 TaxID=3023713 RepID=UPI0037564D58